MPVAVEGLAGLQRALRNADRDVRLGVRKELRHVAEPVRADAQALAAVRIRRMPQSPRWAGMRTGITRNLVYVAPRQKGVRGRGPTARPNLAGLLMDRAMEPALARHEDGIVRELDRMLDRVADQFNRGG